MAFVPYRGEFQYDWQAKTASQVFTIGAIVDIVSGLITVCTITRAPHSGVIQKTVVSTDADYASATVLPVMITGDPTSEWGGMVFSTTVVARVSNGKKQTLHLQIG